MEYVGQSLTLIGLKCEHLSLEQNFNQTVHIIKQPDLEL